MSDVPRSHGMDERLNGRDAAELSGQLAGLASAGLPMAPSLAALAEELPRGRLRRAMQELSDRLAAGMSLEEAIENQKGQIPPHLRGLVIAGARANGSAMSWASSRATSRSAPSCDGSCGSPWRIRS